MDPWIHVYPYAYINVKGHESKVGEQSNAIGEAQNDDKIRI
jgi:hypothetical protein